MVKNLEKSGPNWPKRSHLLLLGKSRIWNSLLEEVKSEEGSEAKVPPEEEVSQNIDNNLAIYVIYVSTFLCIIQSAKVPQKF